MNGLNAASPLRHAHDFDGGPGRTLAAPESGISPQTISSSSLALPNSFKIGSKDLGPFELVTIPEIRAHLAFLGAFAQLKASVKSQTGPDVRGSPDELWAVYLARAVDRFAKWIERGLNDMKNEIRDMKEYEVPPVDVLMVWHTYLLNPRVYYEDGERDMSKLFYIRAFPLHLADAIIDMKTSIPINPTHERKSRFESATSLPWAAPWNTIDSDTAAVPCPRCKEKTINEVHWITSEGTGFAQQKFNARCQVCNSSFDRNAMMARAICDDVIKARNSLKDNSLTRKTFISGTLLDRKTGEPNRVNAISNNDILLKAEFLTPESMRFKNGDQLAKHLNYSIQEIETKLGAGIDTSCRLQQITHILSRYRAPIYPFSIELCGAILRQGAFIDKMVGLGWTNPGVFDDNVAQLARSIARYNAWLNLMSQFTSPIFVPTLDIDLVWHTHQLKHNAYRTQTLAILGRFVDHDDKIEENTLSDAYDQTAKYWEEKYGVPYHVCGCIHPPTRGITAPDPKPIRPPRKNKITRPKPIATEVKPDSSLPSRRRSMRTMITIVSRFLTGRSKGSPASNLVPKGAAATGAPLTGTDTPAPANTSIHTNTLTFTNPFPHLVSIDDRDAPATHPSEHNAVVVTGPNTQSRRATRSNKHAKWNDQAQAAVKQAKVSPDGWEAMNVRRGQDHEQAFARPIPDLSLTPLVALGAETCASYDGGLLDGRTLPQHSGDTNYSAGVCATGMRHSDTLPLGELKRAPPIITYTQSANGTSSYTETRSLPARSWDTGSSTISRAPTRPVATSTYRSTYYQERTDDYQFSATPAEERDAARSHPQVQSVIVSTTETSHENTTTGDAPGCSGGCGGTSGCGGCGGGG